MNKSILVIDTPRSCRECGIMFHDEYCDWCPRVLSINGVYDYVANNTKPEWCPLLPLPEKKDISHYIQRGDAKSNIHLMQYMHDQGWNDCLEEILQEN